MLDVYRSYYGLSGEPFRLGPDYRFSLHHTSYANAKAYLDYAIYQGEGFIAITGGPGTGKTTLISEILATLDRTRVQVATLTSTQLESRDLLYMVASAFGMYPDKFDKAGLLLEIESWLVKKLRSGQRAMLIVDEAQGLSASALEELRLLANLQYQYQLLLQICLVGQETLLGLIHAPGMEHLQQRLVAATALEPLGFDETIDYIEHRLHKVGWQADPTIDEAALRLVYCHSGGTPRRINLIVNRLFLHGGMAHKHRLTGEDARDVIDGLVEEHLLPAQPLVEENTIGPAPADADGKPKVRSLPRPGARQTEKPAAGDTTPDAEAPKRPRGNGGAAVTGERPARDARGKTRRPDAETRTTAAGRSARARRQPSFAARGPEPPLDDLLMRPSRSAPPPERHRSSTSKYLVMAALMAVTAGAGWYLQERMAAFDRLSQMFMGRAPVQATAPVQPEPGVTQGARQDPDVSGELPPGTVASTPGPQTPPAGAIIRRPEPGGTGLGNDGNREAPVADDVAAPASPAGDIAVATPEPGSPVVETGTSPVTGSEPDEPDEPDEPQSVAADEPEPRQTATAAGSLSSAASEPAVEPRPEPAVAQERPAETPPEPPSQAVAESVAADEAGQSQAAAAAAAASSVEAISARRAELREAAEQRFSRQLARLQSTNVTSGAAKPAASMPKVAADTPKEASISEPAASTTAPVMASRPKTATPVKKKPRPTTAEIKQQLLAGRWYSGNNPASLLPSETTFCDTRSGDIECYSVPQNVKTQYGLALYKVETRLSGFSAEGLFEMSYRTLVKLVGDSGASASGDDEGWQVTEYSMSCNLTDDDRISCLDGKGITREYRRRPR